MLRLIRRPDSPHWHISGTLRGQRVRESTGTDSQEHAEAIKVRREKEILDRNVYGEAVTATFAEAVNLYLDLGGEERYLAPLLERWGLRKLAAITQIEIARAGREIYPDAKASTLDRQLYTPVIAVLTKAANAGLCPVPAFERPKVKRGRVEPSDDATIDAILAAGGKLAYKPGSRGEKRRLAARRRLRALVLLMTTTGCRVSEAVDLRRRDVDLDGRRPNVLLAKTKNGLPRRAVIGPEMVEALRALPDCGPGDRIIGYASRYTAAQALERAAVAAGVTPVGPHRIGRHTFAARFLALGKSLKALKDAGGWKSIAIVDQHYGHLEHSTVDDAVLEAAGTRLTRPPSQATAKVLKLHVKK